MVADLSPKPAKPRISPGNRFPEATRLNIKALYVVRGLCPADIAHSLSLKPQQVRNLVAREGWLKLRTKNGETRKKREDAALLARAEADIQRTVENTAILAEDLSLRTLNRCSDILNDPEGEESEKRLQMASGAARNFVQIARLSRGLDVKRGDSANAPGSGPTLIFLGELPRVGDAVKEAKPVTEVSATPVPDSPALT